MEGIENENAENELDMQRNQNIFITANVVEGDVYGVDEVQITGEMVIDEGTLRRLIIVKPGEIFSRKKVEQSVENRCLPLPI